ncbi:MarR family winged helix-turn-helix transcriptional regulator [Actinopolymorpha cephalotaxi]|uniref:DNA-binding MarR family transcriptional regulator n=1 Tax=Actinopolymorpha cephalotaxi TaxID=504797 RepID=A0ABX2SB92_9ACTN|nr:MarR family transcriptional regulator [Actinopolymorpha cephalotaxi]NYH86918.1 DNA-binding MarR family transcriptional regulator [Actinopolymorpha cephalotaxi]
MTKLELRHQVCFALYAASRAVTDVYRPILEELGLTYPQYLVLLVLWERDPDPATVKDLGAALELDSGTLSPLLKRLAAAGLVTRSRSVRDERVVEVALTAAGRALRDRVGEVPRQVAEATGLSEDELLSLRHTLTRITDAVHHQQAGVHQDQQDQQQRQQQKEN